MMWKLELIIYPVDSYSLSDFKEKKEKIPGILHIKWLYTFTVNTVP